MMKIKINLDRKKYKPFWSCKLYLDLLQLGREFHHSQEKQLFVFHLLCSLFDQTCSMQKDEKAATN